MSVSSFALSFYKNTADGVHIQRVEKPREARVEHAHEYYQIYYVAKGALIHYLNGEEARLTAGDMFIIPPGMAHRIEPAEEEIAFYSLSFMPEVVEDARRSAGLAADFLHSLGLEMAVRPKITVPSGEVLRIESLIEQIYEEFSERRLAADETVKLSIALLVTLLARICCEALDSLPVPERADRNHLILRCVDYIEKNYFREITLENIVRLSAISKNEFCRSFRRVTGYTFGQYLNLCRIRKAAEQIRRGDKITAIYAFCGYDDFSTFYRNFVKIMGVSPSQYRKDSAEEST